MEEDRYSFKILNYKPAGKKPLEIGVILEPSQAARDLEYQSC
jgi:hypothetical protein